MNYYNEISKGYDELHGEEQLKKARIIRDKIEFKRSDKLLDVGCGNGAYLDIFDCDVTGIDPSEEFIEQYKGTHQIMIGKAEALDFVDDYFDIVISITAIHNFDDIKKGLEEIKRVGKTKFVFSVLKRSQKFEEIEKLINELFSVKEKVEEDKDIIFFCENQ
ncbi:MAG: methyltransferase domain-containing protein [Nanoarchaeota archaeon]|nr:methyltransferase domain-containing protein [Nanoarchaeota archaeon]MBU1321634.1 methyltransferase domain-containing protein [Nanoarchaeota archaeon]MBU1597418.1 methyltransferase domain-containing protein [Nanoarchaeota archaeon]MBU2440919.1 methyltransferase domain-containing protein [Nanoarchaeota archaeon]